MYLPPHFSETRTPILYSVMQANSLATLITHSAKGIEADHLPLVALERDNLLQGHVARANPVWERVEEGAEVLAIYRGPDAYVSPKWYPSKGEHGKVVPTWNYLVVHARGNIRWTQDPDWLRRHLDAATAEHEGSDKPWRVSDAPADFVERMISGIVGLEISISDLQGKWKLSQNRSARDRQGVMEGLSDQSRGSAAEMLSWMSDDGGDLSRAHERADQDA